jgi:hypothetical protein
MAITAHYMVKDTLNGPAYKRDRLVAFRHLKGSHTGEHLADVFFRVLQELSVLDRVSLPFLKVCASISFWF